MGPKLPMEGHFGPKNSGKILVSNRYRSQYGLKNSRRAFRNIFYVYLYYFYNFWGRQKFLRFWASFWKFDLWGQKFSKIKNFQKSQKTSFFNICCFFVAFWAKWANLSTFAQFCLPEISRVLGGTPWKLGFWLQMHWLQLKQLSRNFCWGSKICAKIKTLKSALKHISVP